MRGMQFLDRLRDQVIVGDGALGTMLGERLGRNVCFERLNLTDEHIVRDLHAAYRSAGSQVLETNTFGANRTKLGDIDLKVSDICRAGVAIAKQAGSGAFIAGSVGPLAGPTGPFDAAPPTDDQIRDLFREPITALADAGADLVVLETFTDLRQLLLALEVAKSATDLPVICMMAFHERGHTPSGVSVIQALNELAAAGADVIGANCGRGVRCVAGAVKEMAAHTDKLVSAYPNAGLPEFVDGRYLFGAPLPYLVESASEMADAGVNLIGGCCGTSPEYIRRVSEALKERKPGVRVRAPAVPKADEATVIADSSPPPGSILEGFAQRGRPLIVVELDPPRGVNYEPIVRRARQLRDMGVDAITMADNPVATLHMGNLGLAHIVQQEAGVPVVLHLACRDHNLLALQSRLLEAHALGVHHVLALTGDPAKVGDQPGATSVYDLNSIGLVDLIRRFNLGVHNGGMSIGGRTKFTIGVAFNQGGNDRKLQHECNRLYKKVEAGAHFAMTQPVYDVDSFHRLHEATKPMGKPILAGLMPLLSERNAEFLHNEVPGICLSDDARSRMKGLSGKDGRAAGQRICKDLIDGMAPTAAGFYVIPPQKFLEMAVELVDHIVQRCAVKQR